MIFERARWSEREGVEWQRRRRRRFFFFSLDLFLFLTSISSPLSHSNSDSNSFQQAHKPKKLFIKVADEAGEGEW